MKDYLSLLEAADNAVAPLWLKQWRQHMDDTANSHWLKQITTMPKVFDDIATPHWLQQIQTLTKTVGSIVRPSWLQQIQTLGTTVDSIVDPPSLRHIQTMAMTVDSIVNPPWLKQIQTLKTVDAVLGPMAAGLRLGRAVEQLGLGRRWSAPELAIANVARLASHISPAAAPSQLLDALQRVGASPLGQSAFAVGQTSPSLFQVSTEALTTLTTLELPESERGEFANPQAAIIEAVTAVRQAIEAGRGDAARLAEDLRNVLAELRSSARDPKLVDRVVAYISLLVTIYFGVVQTNYARLAEERAQRQEAAGPGEAGRGQPSGATSVARDSGRHAVERIVVRAVRLRASQRARSRVVRVLYPGDLVTIVAESGRKVKVKCVDHLRETEFEGWLPKKYLRGW